MKIAKAVPVVLLLLLTTVPLVHAEVKSWELDKAHSNIYFGIDHIFSQVRGHFNSFKTDIKFDSANLEQSSFQIEIEIDSIDTNISKRDKHLQSADFFDAGKYPTMKFVSEKITDHGEGKYDVAGKLTVKGVEYDFNLPLVLAGVKDHPRAKGKEVAGFNGKVTLDRLHYKVGGGKFYQMGVVGKDVDVLVSLELMGKK